MKALLRVLFSPLLKPLESGDEPFEYKPSSRKILVILGALFVGLSTAVTVVNESEDYSYLLAVFVFGGLGVLALIVGLLGEDRAVSKVWGSKRN